MDYNKDGKKDLLSGDTGGNVWLFLNEGTDAAPVLAEGVRLKAGGQPIKGVSPDYEKDSEGKYQRLVDPAKMMGVYSKIHLADFTGDGLKDLLVGHESPAGQAIVIYRNVGTANEPNLAAPEPLELPEPKMSRPSPYVVDWDGDGVVDLLCGTEGAAVFFFRNAGTNAQPKLERGRKLDLVGDDFDKGYRCRIDVVDWNGDGRKDIVVGNFYSHTEPHGGNIWLFLGK